MGLFAGPCCVQQHVLLMLIFQLRFAVGKVFYNLSTLLAAVEW
jgi:hypothetical protein